MFNINWQALAQKLTPYWWRRANFVAMLEVLVSQVNRIYDEFYAYREAQLYALTHTGQTMSIEHILNDRFDPQQRLIYIENYNDLTQTYMYLKAEAQPAPILYLKWQVLTAYGTGARISHNGNVYEATEPLTGAEPLVVPGWAWIRPTFRLIGKNEALQEYDFIVYVPQTIAFDLSEMKGVVNTYKVAGKRYRIETY